MKRFKRIKPEKFKPQSKLYVSMAKTETPSRKKRENKRKSFFVNIFKCMRGDEKVYTGLCKCNPRFSWLITKYHSLKTFPNKFKLMERF